MLSLYRPNFRLGTDPTQPLKSSSAHAELVQLASATHGPAVQLTSSWRRVECCSRSTRCQGVKDDNAGGPTISTWHPSTGDGSEPARPAAGPSWSTTGAEGVRSWSSYQDLYAKDSNLRKKLPTHNTSKESGPDWQILGEAAAEIARFKGQQQTLNNSQPTSSTPGGGGTSSTSRPALQRQIKRNIRRLMKRVADLPGWLLYRYYNWRQDGVSDLMLVTAASSTLLFTAALVKLLFIDVDHAAIDAAAATAAGATGADAMTDTSSGGSVATGGSGPTSSLNSFMSALWADVYTVMVLSFGENFPDAAQSGPVEEVFDVLVALAGLAGFALALALVEQVVLETNLANVKRGSKVYEMGHYLVLGWAVSQRDLEVLIKLVGQLCCAAAAEGGTTVVVLTMREKLEMEDIFRYALPASQRLGSHLVFRQGSPLLPSDLSLVAASSARATIILSDQSRSRDEADAQSLRVAILLDELDDYRGLKKGRALGHIVVETRTSNAVPLLRYSCSKRVIALPTLQLNARRLARMVKRPFISWVSQRLWAFNSRCSLYIEAVPPELSGTRFRHLPYLYPDGIILGVAHINSGNVTLNPMLDYTLQPDDQLIFCRPTAIRSSEHKPLSQLMTIPELERLGQEQLQEQEAKAAAASKDKDWLDRLVDQHWLQLLLNWMQDLHNVGLQQQQQPQAQQHSRQNSPANDGSGMSVIDNLVSGVNSHARTDAPQAAMSQTGQKAPGSQSSSINSGTGLRLPAPFAAVVCNLSPKHSTASGSPSDSLAGSLADYVEASKPNSSSSNYGSTFSTVPNQQPLLQKAATGSPLVPASTAAAGPATAAAVVASGSTAVNGTSASATSSVQVLDTVAGSTGRHNIGPVDSAILSDTEEVPGLVMPGNDFSIQSNLDRVDFTSFMSSDDEEVLQQSDRTAGPQFSWPFSSDGRGTDGRSTAASDSTQLGPGATEQGPASERFDLQDTADLSAGGGGRVYDVAGWSMLKDDTLDSMDVLHEDFLKDSSVDHDSQQALAQDLPTAANSTTVDVDCSPGTGAAGPTGEAGVHKTSSSAAATVQPSGTERSGSPAASTIVAPGSTKVVDAFSDSSSLEYVPREYLAVDSSPQSILVAGWAELGFMQHLLWELDQGSSCLPPGSEIVFVNSHPPDDTLGAVLRRRPLTNVRVSHVLADPLQRSQLALLPLSRFRAALVLADERWSDPDGDDSNGIDSIDQPSVLRQDAMMVMVQLNIRKLLDELQLPPINIICQKVATQGLTRFEDRRRLPLGISINFNSMAAKLLTQVSVNPLTLLVITGLGGCADLTIVDASEYCARGEAISFWAVMSRAQAAGDVLMGYYVLPSVVDQPIESTINPQGLATRAKQRVWNTGDGRLKFMIIRDKECGWHAGADASGAAGL